MKIPLSWLREFVDVPEDVSDLVEKLTFSGIEVEGVVTVGEGLDSVVAGRVVAWEKHPNADRLRLCRVDDGTEVRQVVCGATNFSEGDIAAFAPAGTVLPNGMKLKVAKVRGEVSEGMLCAEDELGLSEAHDGILLLPASAELGAPLSKFYPPETVLALEITWNRPDCLSVLGVARELAALYEVPLRAPENSPLEAEGNVKDAIEVQIDDSQACTRYTAHLLRGVKIVPSPSWVQQRLEHCGIRPINNIVDATNYVMLELGQPLHAFDFSHLRGDKIIVRKALDGEVLHTLDEEERKLDSDMLVIADEKGAVAVAGIMGGQGSEITGSTSDVLIESAGFDPRTVRYGSVKLGLSSESSHRFERGVDETQSRDAGARALSLMQDWGGGTPAAGCVDVYPTPYQPITLSLRADRLRAVLGIEVPADEVERILRSLLFSIEQEKDGCWAVRIPSFRRDVTCEADLVEEIARMHGIDAVPERLPAAKVVQGADDVFSRQVYRSRELLAGAGFSEAMHYSFLSDALLNEWNQDDASSRIVLPNPVSSDQGTLRNSLIPQLFESLARNRARQTESAALFETGTIYQRSGDGTPEEALHAGIGLMGRFDIPGRQNRAAVTSEEVYYCLKGIVEQFGVDLGVSELGFTAEDHPYFNPGESSRIVIGQKTVGYIGLVRKELCSGKRISVPVAMAELSLSEILKKVDVDVSYHPIPSYPSVSRDLAAYVDESITHEKMLAVIEKNAPVELTEISLFDIFKGKEIEQGKKSMGYSLTYQSATKTLTDEEVNLLHDGVKNALKGEVGVQFRE